MEGSKQPCTKSSKLESAGLEKIFEQFKNQRILVVGDVMVDAYLWGKVNRISPEAPVPVVAVSQKDNRLGGAANVALNIHEMGATPIVCTVVGSDEKGLELKRLFAHAGLPVKGIVESSKRPTTVKTRIISQNQQMLRVDEETTEYLNEQDIENLIAVVQNAMNSGVTGLVFQDYNKGVLTPTVISRITALAHESGIPIAVDPKKENFFEFKDVQLFKPNLRELKEGLKYDAILPEKQELDQACNTLKSKIQCAAAMITLSEHGVYMASKSTSQIIPAYRRNISDVSGAGDTVISVAALCMASEQSAALTAWLSNLAGGLVCEEVGVVPIRHNVLQQEAEKHLEDFEKFSASEHKD